MLACAGAVQAQRLTEFLAINTSGIKDEDGTRQPWIEIWNNSPTTVTTLTNYKLSHTVNGVATVWNIPTIQIMPDERIIIWASGKSRSVVTAPLHTSFVLQPTAGSTISLLNSANTVVSSFASYPEQGPDVSWGRDDSDTVVIPVQVGPYAEPSPGAKNHNYTGGGVAGGVVFSETSRAWNGSLSVTLSQAVPEEGAVIRYTTNLTLPSATSNLYTAPINFTATSSSTVIRARVFKAGKLPGPATTHGFLRLDANALNFSSLMPIVVISTFSAVPPDDGDQASFMWVWEPTGADKRARFSNPPVLTRRTVVDKRGSSTLGNAKFSLNVETRTPYDEDSQAVSLLGMPSHSDWVFHAPFDFDRSVMHNPLMYAMSNLIGRYAVRNQMAEVFMDVTGGGLTFPGNAGGDYFGIYNVMEKIRRDNNRVDIAKLDTYDNGPLPKTGGYIFKVDRVDAGDNGFSAGNQSFAYYYPKERELISPQRDPQEKYLTLYINEFNTRLSSVNFKDPVLGYATHLDVPAAIDHHLLNVWSFNVDALRLSGYWTKDRNGKFFPGPIWDFDRTLSSTDGRDENPAVWRSTSGDQGTDFFNFTWWNRLFLDPGFYQAYIDRWQELRAGPLARTNLEALIDSINAQMSQEAINRDVVRWGNAKRSWKRPFAAPNNNLMPASQAAEVQRLKDYLQQRANFMDSQWVGRVTASRDSGYVDPGTLITLTGPAGVPIYYTLDGTDPRPAAGTAPGVAATLYTAPIPITANGRLRARAYKANHTALTGANNPPLVSKWGGPADLTFTTEEPVKPGDVILSEINYNPSAPTPAELAVNPAWSGSDFTFLEIRNISGRRINLTGANFTRGITFAFNGAAARALAPRGTLIIAANPAAFAARYGSALTVSGPWTGSLSKSGENITLTGGNGAVVFSVGYQDDWVPESDNGGYSMVAAEFYPFDFSTAPAWRRSAQLGGSPGLWDAASLAVSAGPDTSAGTGLSFLIAGEIPGATFRATRIMAWTQVSGPGTITFATPGQAATQATADAPGVYRVRLSLTVNEADPVFDEANLFVADTPYAWLARNPGIGALMDDPDGDGRNNFLEFALLTSPTVPDGSQPPSAGLASNRLSLLYQRQKAASGLTYQVEISDSPGIFRLPNPGELTETILVDTGISQSVRITDTAVPGTPARRFLRLKVSAP